MKLKRMRGKNLLWLSVITMLIVSVAFVNVTSASPTTIFYVDPPEVTGVPSGYTFQITINVTDAPTSYAWEIWSLSWDPGLLELVSVAEGDFLHRWQEIPFPPYRVPLYDTTLANTPLGEANAEGKIMVTCSLIGALPEGEWASGDGWLMSLNFLVTGEGSCVLDLFDTTLYDHMEAGYPAPTPYPNEDGFFSNLLPLPQYSLTISATSGGTTDPSPGTYLHVEGTVVSVTAMPDAGYFLDHWELDDVNVGDPNPLEVTMDANHTLTAVFTEIPGVQHELTIDVDGSGSTDPAPGVHSYAEGTDVPVDAIPDSGWMLDHWELDGVDVGSADPYTVTMDTDHALAAFFLEVVTPPLTYFYVDPPEVKDFQPGDIFLISINVNDAPTTYAWEVHVSWDPALLEVFYKAEGDFLSRGIYTTSFLSSPSFDEANIEGEIMVGCFLSGYVPMNEWATGDGWLFNLGFNVTGEGSCVLDLFGTSLFDHLVAEFPAPTYYPNLDGFFYNEPFHDIAVDNVAPDAPEVHAGDPLTIDVTVTNEGNYTETSETFNVTVYADITVYEYEYDAADQLIKTTIVVGDEIIVGTQTVTEPLAPGATTTITFTWDTTGVVGETYTISAEVMGDDDTRDNMFIDGEVAIRWDHDLKVTDVTVLTSEVLLGELANMTVNVLNQGTNPESFTLQVNASETINIETIFDSLDAGANRTYEISWDTTGVAVGSYTISAYVPPVPGEVDPNIADNLFVDGTITVTTKPPPIHAIYIRADGSVDPDTAPISSVDNITYTFTDNIYNEIVVERDNIVVDGAGYTLQGTGFSEGETGIFLNGISNVTIKNTKIKSFELGIRLYGSSNNTVSGNNITKNGEGIRLDSSSNNDISGNNMTANYWFGIRLGLYGSSNNNSIFSNNITDNTWGISLHDSLNNSVSGNNIEANNIDGIGLEGSSNNIISGNIITNNPSGIFFYYSSNNIIYHNNFINNTQQVYIYTSGYANFWDNGYPSGGNYWSDHLTVDDYSGINQDELGSDGIVDEPYIIDDFNRDNYPLVEPWTPLPPIPTTLYELKTKVEELGSEGEIDNKGIVKSLIAKLNLAQKLVDKGKVDEAKSILADDFIPQVQNLSGIRITVEAADILIESAEYIMSHL